MEWEMPNQPKCDREKAAKALRAKRYQVWIYDRLTRMDSWNACEVWTRDMMAQFPELIRVRGWVMVPGIGERPHWWLKTPDGDIVDPTEQQYWDVLGTKLADGTLKQAYYGGAGVQGYREVDETNPPIGRCMNCGNTCYKLTAPCSMLCTAECEASYAAYMQREMEANERRYRGAGTSPIYDGD